VPPHGTSALPDVTRRLSTGGPPTWRRWPSTSWTPKACSSCTTSPRPCPNRHRPARRTDPAAVCSSTVTSTQAINPARWTLRHGPDAKAPARCHTPNRRQTRHRRERARIAGAPPLPTAGLPRQQHQPV